MDAEQVAILLAPYEAHIRSLAVDRFNLTQELAAKEAEAKEYCARAELAEAELSRIKDESAQVDGVNTHNQ